MNCDSRNGDNEGLNAGRKKFEEYYQGQGIVPTAEWEDFMNYLGYNLPITFRIVQGTPHTDYIRKKIEEHRERALNEGFHIKELSWYPQGDAYSISISRYDLRSNAFLKDFHQFLVNESNAGLIFRQEAVSMIPPLFLNIEKHHLTLDMCASPGSKTSQIIEEYHKLAQNQAPSESLPSGAVVANDVNSRRAHLLIHNLRHLHSPFLIVTNHPAQRFPQLYDTNLNQFIRYDSVICDVPCTADGTLRKSPSIWKRWHPHDSVGAHRLQIQILRRGAELCKIGGKIIYSTCSLNPIENEAVIASLIESATGSIEISVEQISKDLKSAQGLTTWKVFWCGSWYDKYEDLPLNVQASKKLQQSCFPPTESNLDYLKDCQRYLPHLNDTGGFFVTILKKVKEVPWINENRYKLSQTEDTSDGNKLYSNWISQSDYLPLASFSSTISGAQIWESICKSYGFDSIANPDKINYFFDGITYKPASDDQQSIKQRKTGYNTFKSAALTMPRKLWYAEEGVRRFLLSKTRSKFIVLISGCVISQSTSSNSNQMLKPCSYRLQHGAIDWLIRSNLKLKGPQVIECDAKTLCMLLEGNQESNDSKIQRDIRANLQANPETGQSSSISYPEIESLSQIVDSDIRSPLLSADTESRSSSPIGNSNSNIEKFFKKSKAELFAQEINNNSKYRVAIEELKSPVKERLENLPQDTSLLINIALKEYQSKNSSGINRQILLPMWKGKKNLELMLSNTTRCALSWLIKETWDNKEAQI